ncbi:hypothetical protein [Glycomyces endophyticus]|uniref:hypothetical protein n=1 Tax=Glycomyces endophyticus TaxID=480996 RepID=UPI0031DB3E6B
MNRILLRAVLIPVLFSLLGLHGRKRKKPRTRSEGRSNEGDSRKADEQLNRGAVDDSDAPADSGKPKDEGNGQPPPKKKPKFEFDEDMVDATWEKHRPGGYYDSQKPPVKNNVYHKDFTKDDLRAALLDAQQNGVDRPRGVNSDDIMRSGKYVYWNPYTDKPTGVNGQTGLLIPVAGDGNMKTAYPFES